MDFAEARYYNNAHARFTAVDPLLSSGKSDNPQTFNRYVYVGNNPINITDPFGLDWYSRSVKDTTKTEYQWFDENPNGDWSAVDFGGFSATYIQINNVCEKDGCNGTAYLYKYGGWDHGERIEQTERRILESGLPWRWQESMPEPVGYAEASKRRFGGQFTITDNGETDYEAYKDIRDRDKSAAMALGMMGSLGAINGGAYTPSGGGKGFSNALAQKVANTFRSGKYTEITLEENMVLGRYYDNQKAFAKGSFMSAHQHQ